MRAIHHDPRRMLLAGLAALVLMLMALWVPMQLSQAGLSLGLPDRSAPAPSQVVERGSPPPLENPLDSPLMRWMR
ncbi:MAG TPA: hypothetical protein VM299_03035 [Solirubrobacteraceae bacterium]|jgi:hypothetical protein|nr:hypothetical protein [Solirubrobacteraceae bacterium]